MSSVVFRSRPVNCRRMLSSPFLTCLLDTVKRVVLLCGRGQVPQRDKEQNAMDLCTQNCINMNY